MGAQTKRILDCAEVLPGYALKARAEHEPEGAYQVLMAKHVNDCLPYRYSQDHELRMNLKWRAEKYRVFVGDVLFVSRGIRNCAAAVEAVPENTIASSTFYILRPNNQIESSYLAWCLNQPPVQAQISQVRTGSGTPIVQRVIFGDIKIPIPSLAEQKPLAELSKLMIEEQTLRKRLVEATDTYHKAIGTKIISQLSKN